MKFLEVVLLLGLVLPSFGQQVSPHFRAKSMEMVDEKDFQQYEEAHPSAGAPGVQVWAEKWDRTNWIKVSPATQFLTGEVVRFVIATNFLAGITITNVDSTGKTTHLFPVGTQNNHFPPGHPATTPAFRFKDNPGEELVLFQVEKVQEIAEQARPSESSPGAQQPASRKKAETQKRAEGKKQDAPIKDVQEPIDFIAYSKQQMNTKGGDYATAVSRDRVTILARRDDTFAVPVVFSLKLQHKAR